MPELLNLETALRRTRNFAELVEVASSFGLGASLQRPISTVWEDEVVADRPGAALLRVLFNAQAKAPIGVMLGQRERWQFAKSVLTSAQRHGVLTQLQDWLLQTAPDAARASLIPAGGDDASLAPVGPGRRMSVPQAGDPTLLQWAVRAGVEDLLETPLRNLGKELEGDVAARRALLGFSYFAKVEDVLLGSGARDAQEARVAQEAVRGWLLARACEVQRAREEEQQPVSPPKPPALAAAFAELSTLRASLRKAAVPTPSDVLRQGRLQLLLESTAWRFTDPRLLHSDGYVIVRLEDHGGASAHCICRRETQACKHALAAVDCVLHWLGRGNDSAELALLEQELASPAWERTLSAIERNLPALEAASPEVDVGLLSWRLSARGPHDHELRPYLQRPTQRGGWSTGAKVRLELVADSHSPWVEAEDRAAALLLRQSKGREPAAVFGALELLTHSGRVFLDGEPGAPLTIVRAPMGLLCREVKGGYTLVPAVQDCQLPESQFLRWSPNQIELVSRLHVDLEHRRCFLLDDTARALAAQVVLLSRSQVFPLEAGEAVVERLERAGLVLDVPDALQGQAFSASTRPVVHLLRRDGLTFRIELRVRPLSGGLAFPMGEGPVRLRGSVDGVRGHVVRELAAEREAAEALWMQLGLPGPGHDREVEGEGALKLLLRLETLAGDGLEVVWPAARPSLSRPAQKKDLKLAVREGRDWFGLRGQVEVDGHALDLAALLEAARARRRFVPVGKDAFVTLSASLSEQLTALGELAFEGRNGLEVNLTAAGELEALAPELGCVEVSVAFRDLAAQVRAAGAQQLSLPKGLVAELRPYQQEGFAWLARLSSWAPGACLADDMGLGKTLQALALLVDRAAQGPALVVAPTSVCFNWRREAERFAPGLRIVAYAGDAQVLEGLGPGDVLVVSYGRLTRDAERFQTLRFATAIFDEAQAVKNANTQRSRACRDLDVGFRVALTGTPLENHLGELWSLFRVIFPGLLGSEEQFRARFWGPIERTRDPQAQRGLARLVRPFLLRRTKREVATELPPRIDVNVTVSLSPAEQRLYDEARLSILEALQGRGGRPADQRFEVLAALTRLRLLACHPVLHDLTWTGPTSKLTRFLELVEELRQQGHRALVFSQFTKHLELVRAALRERGVTFQYLDGATPEADRQRGVDAFQRGEGELFLISLKAGGTGLNLTAADNVIHLDPWWNPAVEDQATDRAHRIGQTRTVTVYRLLTRGTIEEQILALHGHKRELIAGVLEGSDAATRLDTDALAALLEAGPVEVSDAQDALLDASTDGAQRLARVALPRALPAEVGTTDAVPATALTAQALPIQAPAEVAGVRGARAPRGGGSPLPTNARVRAAGAQDEGRGEGSAAASAVSLLAASLPSLAGDFRTWLASEGKSAKVVASYPRAVERFAAFVQTRKPTKGGLELAPLAEAYLAAVRDGTYDAPASDASLGKTALKTLGQFLKTRS